MKYIVDKHSFHEFAFVFNKRQTITSMGNSFSFTETVEDNAPYRINYTMYEAYYGWHNKGYNNDMPFLAKATPIFKQKISDFTD